MRKSLLVHFAIWWQYLIVFFFAFFFGFPLFWMIFSSFKTSRELIGNIWTLPDQLNFTAYQSVLAIPEFKSYYINSILITIISVVMLTVVATLAAYTIARIPFPGRNIILYLFLAGMMIPLHTTLIPLYITLREMGLLNKLLSLLFPYVGFGLPMSIYILQNFFKEVPVELEEAARLDGASTVQIFWRIILPLSRPALITVIILNVISIWNEYLLALTLVSGNNRAYTLPLGIYSIVTSVSTFQYDLALSALTLVALPVLILFFVLHRQIVKGLVARALG